MKLTTLLVPGLFCLLSASAFAQGQNDIAGAHQDIRAEHHDIAVEKNNLAHDKVVAKMAKRDAVAVKRQQQDMVARGDYQGAQQIERERVHQKHVAKIARHQVRQDRDVIAVKRANVAHDKDVIAVERH